MELFRQAEQVVQDSHPRFRAEAIATITAPGDLEAAERRVEACLRAAKEGLAGADFIPQPYDQEAEWTDLYRWADRFADAGMGITVHAGEFSEANLGAALGTPGVTRIGHAVYAGLSPRLAEQVLRSGVTVECCLTSNRILGAVDSIESHPMRNLVDAGIPVTINTDNPVRFHTSIDHEYRQARELGFSDSDLLNFTRNAVNASYTSAERRTGLLALIDETSVSE